MAEARGRRRRQDAAPDPGEGAEDVKRRTWHSLVIGRSCTSECLVLTDRSSFRYNLLDRQFRHLRHDVEQGVATKPPLLCERPFSLLPCEESALPRKSTAGKVDLLSEPQSCEAQTLRRAMSHLRMTNSDGCSRMNASNRAIVLSCCLKYSSSISSICGSRSRSQDQSCLPSATNSNSSR